ncbi:MAG: PaaI family thioesterase [Pseudomonadota bacterium]
MTVVLEPEIETGIRESFARQGLLVRLGARLDWVRQGQCQLSADFGEAVSQQHGFFHGGFIGALGDVAGGYAALSFMPAGSEVLTVEYKVNFLRPAKGERLEALASVLKPGRRLTVTRVDLAVVAEERSQLVATLQQTIMRVEAADG